MNNQDTRRLSDSLLQNGSSQYKVRAEIKSNDVAVNVSRSERSLCNIYAIA